MLPVVEVRSVFSCPERRAGEGEAQWHFHHQDGRWAQPLTSRSRHPRPQPCQLPRHCGSQDATQRMNVTHKYYKHTEIILFYSSNWILLFARSHVFVSKDQLMRTSDFILLILCYHLCCLQWTMLSGVFTAAWFTCCEHETQRHYTYHKLIRQHS